MFRSQVAKALYNQTKGRAVSQACGIRARLEGNAGKSLAAAGATNTIEFLEGFGIDVSKEIIMPISRRLVYAADTVIVMADSSLWPTYLDLVHDLTVWPVPNPDPTDPLCASRVGRQISDRVAALISADNLRPKRRDIRAA